VTADAGEHVDELARLGQPQLAVLGGVPAEPAHGGTLEPERVIVADEQHEAERVGQVDVSEFGRRREREVRVADLECALELSVSVACDVMEERMFA
jgi:hypothetical protein